MPENGRFLIRIYLFFKYKINKLIFIVLFFIIYIESVVARALAWNDCAKMKIFFFFNFGFAQRSSSTTMARMFQL